MKKNDNSLHCHLLKTSECVLFDQALIGLALIEPDSLRIHSYNAMFGLFHQDIKNLNGRKLGELYPEDASFIERLLHATGKIQISKVCDGQKKILSYDKSRMQVGDVCFILCSTQDVTVENEEYMKYKRIFESSNEAMMILGETFLDCNPATTKMFTCTKEEFCCCHPADISPPTQPDGRDSFEKASEMIKAAYQDGRNFFKWSHKRLNGEIFPAEVLLTPMVWQSQKVVQATVRDLTEQVQLENKLRQSQKLEAIGHLTAGIAHDFNNILCAMIGSANLISDNPDASAVIVDDARVIEDQGKKASRLIRALMDFSRKSTLNQELLDLSIWLKNIQLLIARTIPVTITTEFEIASDPMFVNADANQLQQALINLIINAVDALEGHGTIKIDLRKTSTFAAIDVKDNGSGIAPEVAEKVFNPFFTTKEVGKGTGLGLSQALGICEQHSGKIVLDSQLGRGTVFTILLPLTADTKPTQQKEENKCGEISLKGKLLVVEDEPTIIKLVARYCKGLGIDIVSAPNGQKGLEIFQSLDTEIGLVLTDSTMPKMTGLELRAKILESRPDLPFIVMSGYTMPNDSDVINWLEKPFSCKEFCQALRKAIDR